MSFRNQWVVYRGESTNSSDLLFTAKECSLIQVWKTQLKVFLASNTSENVYDFKVKGRSFERSWTICVGESNTIIAQMNGRDKLEVTVYPNVDYAFVIALVVILDEINRDRENGNKLVTNIIGVGN
ncbi:Protein LURP-one-related 10 [Acorus calamus]|uniref:Protein LURP-one-related 10 n=1 Tax=Acorus calamus TaxID=4465 RepID=A0AAV9C7P3_ACOCL|nr:Protein LURP-one-related 10 [Acorus calamus]